MRRLAFLAAALLAGLAAAPGAHAQGIFISFGDGERPVSELYTHVRVTGAVSVDFHGAGESGTVIWDPSGRADLLSVGFRRDGRRYEDAFLSFGTGQDGDQPATRARVRRDDGAGLCADAVSGEFQTVGPDEQPGSSVELGLISDPADGLFPVDTFRTRCAGPTAADIRAALPRRSVTERAVRQGGARVDLSADGPFSAGGLSGTVHSTVVLHLGRTQDLLAQSSPEPTRTRRLRQRAIDVNYRIESVGGQVVTGVQGLADPDLCGPLDACGLMGTVTTAPSSSSGQLQLSAQASLRHSRLELRRAVGLAPGGRPKGVQAFGSGFWGHDRGTITSALQRDGATAGGCADTVPIGPAGGVSLAIARDRVRTSYGGSFSLASDPLRTRCPGPSIADAAGSGALATGTAPLRAFASPRVTLHLTTGRSWSADGYHGTTRPDVTVVLRRTRVHEYVQSFDVPVGFPKLRVR